MASTESVNNVLFALLGTDAAGLTPTLIPVDNGVHFWVRQSVYGALAATAANYSYLWVADRPCVITAIRERHETAGNDAGTVTLMVKKVPSGTAIASGTDTLAAGINLKATADINQQAVLHGTLANYTFAVGDALALVTTGTLTALAGVSVTVTFRPV
jgi:hypothetical protein